MYRPSPASRKVSRSTQYEHARSSRSVAAPCVAGFRCDSRGLPAARYCGHGEVSASSVSCEEGGRAKVRSGGGLLNFCSTPMGFRRAVFSSCRHDLTCDQILPLHSTHVETIFLKRRSLHGYRSPSPPAAAVLVRGELSLQSGRNQWRPITSS